MDKSVGKDLLNTVTAIAVFAVALFGPLFFLRNQFNEKHPLTVFIVTIPLYALAGYIVGKRVGEGKANLKWVGWCAVVGAVAASMICFAV